MAHHRALVWRAKRNKNQSATLRPLPRNIPTRTAQYYAVGVTTSTPSYCREHFCGGNAIFSDPVILQLCLKIILVRIGHVVLDSDFVHVLKIVVMARSRTQKAAGWGAGEGRA